MIFLGYSFFFGDMGYLKYKKLKQNEQKLLKEINEISAENTAIKNEINLLKIILLTWKNTQEKSLDLLNREKWFFNFRKKTDEHQLSNSLHMHQPYYYDPLK